MVSKQRTRQMVGKSSWCTGKGQGKQHARELSVFRQKSRQSVGQKEVSRQRLRQAAGNREVSVQAEIEAGSSKASNLVAKY